MTTAQIDFFANQFQKPVLTQIDLGISSTNRREDFTVSEVLYPLLSSGFESLGHFPHLVLSAADFSMPPIISLTEITNFGSKIKQDIISNLEKMRIDGLISEYSEVEMGERSARFEVVMPSQHWNLESRTKIHELALDLQDKLEIVIMFDLRREYGRAKHT